MAGRKLQLPNDATIHERLAEEIRTAEEVVDSVRSQLKGDTEKMVKEVAACEALKQRLAHVKNLAPFLAKELEESKRRTAEAINRKQRLEQNLMVAQKSLAQLQLAKEQLGKPA